MTGGLYPPEKWIAIVQKKTIPMAMTLLGLISERVRLSKNPANLNNDKKLGAKR